MKQETVEQIKAQLRSYLLPVGGNRAQLLDRLHRHLVWRDKVQEADLSKLRVKELEALVRESDIGPSMAYLRNRAQLTRWLTDFSHRAPQAPASQRGLWMAAVIWTNPITRTTSLFGFARSRPEAERAAAAARRILAQIPFEAHLPVEIRVIGSPGGEEVAMKEAWERWGPPPSSVEYGELRDLRLRAAGVAVRSLAEEERAMAAYVKYHRDQGHST